MCNFFPKIHDLNDQCLGHRKVYLTKSVSINSEYKPKYTVDFTNSTLSKLVKACDQMAQGQVYKAVFLLAYFGFLRLSNLAPTSSSSCDITHHLLMPHSRYRWYPLLWPLIPGGGTTSQVIPFFWRIFGTTVLLLACHGGSQGLFMTRVFHKVFHCLQHGLHSVTLVTLTVTLGEGRFPKVVCQWCTFVVLLCHCGWLSCHGCITAPKLQGGVQHHIPVCARGVWGYLPDLQGRAAEVSKYPTEWREKAQQFDESWNFCHDVAALDGKFVAMRCPRQLGSKYYNYKGFYWVVMFALVDADYKFLWPDVGSNGCCSDAQMFY